ncbi:hypothetical protein HGM15179_012080 [Zosterops borbonicus]|uniref:Uncharacterized protein n=1 Tax=Zosterops borbonicus TaxID=364589 RepID=A0A8K1GAH2_9PASS|nr:hypothetical protein HGM15179_012080 [Zosterops borbonicus]
MSLNCVAQNWAQHSLQVWAHWGQAEGALSSLDLLATGPRGTSGHHSPPGHNSFASSWRRGEERRGEERRGEERRGEERRGEERRVFESIFFRELKGEIMIGGVVEGSGFFSNLYSSIPSCMKPARCFLQMMEMENTHLQNYQDAISGLVKKSGLNFCMVWLRMVPGDTCKFTSMAVLCKASNFMTLRTTVIRLSGVQAGCKSHVSLTTNTEPFKRFVCTAYGIAEDSGQNKSSCA